MLGVDTANWKSRQIQESALRVGLIPTAEPGEPQLQASDSFKEYTALRGRRKTTNFATRAVGPFVNNTVGLQIGV